MEDVVSEPHRLVARSTGNQATNRVVGIENSLPQTCGDGRGDRGPESRAIGIPERTPRLQIHGLRSADDRLLRHCFASLPIPFLPRTPIKLRYHLGLIVATTSLLPSALMLWLAARNGSARHRNQPRESKTQ